MTNDDNSGSEKIGVNVSTGDSPHKIDLVIGNRVKPYGYIW